MLRYWRDSRQDREGEGGRQSRQLWRGVSGNKLRWQAANRWVLTHTHTHTAHISLSLYLAHSSSFSLSLSHTHTRKQQERCIVSGVGSAQRAITSSNNQRHVGGNGARGGGRMGGRVVCSSLVQRQPLCMGVALVAMLSLRDYKNINT